MRNIFFLGVTLTAISLAGCQTVKVETAPVTSSLAPYQQPAKYQGAVWTYQKGDKVVESTRVSLAATEETWSNTEGCKFSRYTTGFAPTLRWTGCSSADGTQNVSGDGPSWPIGIGSTFSYEFNGQNVRGDSWSGTRRCEVTEEVRITVPAGTFDTYHLVCEDPFRSRHWYLSPELETSVLYWDRHKRRGETRRFELISWDPGSGTS